MEEYEDVGEFVFDWTGVQRGKWQSSGDGVTTVRDGGHEDSSLGSEGRPGRPELEGTGT